MTADKNILVLGAGKSSGILIKYLLEHLSEMGYKTIVADLDLKAAQDKIKNNPNGKAVELSANDFNKITELIDISEVIISMLPATMHLKIAEICLDKKKHLVTASYKSPEMDKLDAACKEKGLIFLNECGLDPGIDHMSAMQVIDKIKSEGGEFKGFETFTGGLLANGQNPNPWNYKFTWNPKNVITGGQGVVHFIQEGRFKYIPYHRLFNRTEIIKIPGYGEFEGYANRDSLKYRAIYGLENIPTIYRGTLRRPGFCKSWNVFVQLGATDDTYEMQDVENMTHRDFINSFLAYNPYDSVELKLAHYLRLELDGVEMRNLKWVGVFKDTPVGLKSGTPAKILQHILEKKWTLNPEDKDMIVMWHKFDYITEGVKRQMQSSLVIEGKDAENTAMAFTVGMPVGIATKLILQGKIKEKGVQLPIKPHWYNPILKELQQQGLHMQEWMVVPHLQNEDDF
ncbi:MAG: saccharopine dehydrogenase [Chitinophagaceae bacterium]|nr:MAG: saccharopine dehydrogenase [Chitinophagaceae bacterium]